MKNQQAVLSASFEKRAPSAFRGNLRDAPQKADDVVPVQMGATGIPTISGSRDFEDFVYILSHDIRASVRALAEIPVWIHEDIIEAKLPMDESLSENLMLLESHSRRLDQMLLDLLKYSRVGRKQVTRPIHLDIAINNAMLLLDIPPHFKIQTDIAVKSIVIGEDDIETLIHALLSNAIMHHDKQQAEVKISSRPENGMCCLTVQDDGPGVPEEIRPRMLEAMTTLKSRDETEGSGMGLAIVRKIVDLYGGRIEWGDPAGETGTTLHIYLPM